MEALALGAVLFAFVSWSEVLVLTGATAAGPRRDALLAAVLAAQSVLLGLLGTLPPGLIPGLRPEGLVEGWAALAVSRDVVVLWGLEGAALWLAARAYALNATALSAIGAGVFSTMALIPPLAMAWDAIFPTAGRIPMEYGGPLGLAIWIGVLATGSCGNFWLRPRGSVPAPGAIAAQVVVMSTTFVASMRLAQTHDPIRAYALIDAALALAFGLAAAARGSLGAVVRHPLPILKVAAAGAFAVCAAMAAARIMPLEYAAVAKRSLQAAAGYGFEAWRARLPLGARSKELAVVVAMAGFALAFKAVVR